MSSDEQNKANRLNAQQSTGPGTAEGKARVSLNAVKHGLTARQVVLPSENPDEFDAYRADLLGSLNPQGGLEAALAEKIVTDGWRLRRIPFLEAALFHRGHQELADWLAICAQTGGKQERDGGNDDDNILRAKGSAGGLEKETGRPAAHNSSHYATRVLEDFSTELSNLSRHETALIRSWLRAMHELERLQARRAGEHVPAPAVMDVNVHVSEDSPGTDRAKQ